MGYFILVSKIVLHASCSSRYNLQYAVLLSLRSGTKLLLEIMRDNVEVLVSKTLMHRRGQNMDCFSEVNHRRVRIFLALGL